MNTEKSNAQTEQEQSNLGLKTVSNGFFALWEKSVNSLTKEELEWFAQFTDEAELAGKNLSGVLNGLGCLIGSDDNTGSFQDQGAVSELLFNLSHQIDTINGMIQIGSSAEHRLRHPERYKVVEKQKAAA